MHYNKGLKYIICILTFWEKIWWNKDLYTLRSENNTQQRKHDVKITSPVAINI